MVLGEGDGKRVLSEGHSYGVTVTRITTIPTGIIIVGGSRVLLISSPQAFSFKLEPIQWPWRINAGFVVGDDLIPGLGRGNMPLTATPDPVADYP